MLTVATIAKLFNHKQKAEIISLWAEDDTLDPNLTKVMHSVASALRAEQFKEAVVPLNAEIEVFQKKRASGIKLYRTRCERENGHAPTVFDSQNILAFYSQHNVNNVS